MLDITKTSSVIKVKLELIRVKHLIDWNSYAGFSGTGWIE